MLVSRRIKVILTVLSITLSLVFIKASPAAAWPFKPSCKSIYPNAVKQLPIMVNSYNSMMTFRNKGNYSKAYSYYLILNKAQNTLNSAIGKNYGCFIEKNTMKGSTYEWNTNFPKGYGGPAKSLCLLWNVGCAAPKSKYYDPCADASDYQSCIEDQGRPTGDTFVD